MTPKDPVIMVDLTPHAHDDVDRYEGWGLVVFLVLAVVAAAVCWPEGM